MPTFYLHSIFFKNPVNLLISIDNMTFREANAFDIVLSDYGRQTITMAKNPHIMGKANS